MAAQRTNLIVSAFIFLLATSSEIVLANVEPKPKSASKEEYPLIQWTDLIPADDLEALLNPPAYLNEIPENSPEDQMGNQVHQAIANASDDRYQQALVSKRVRPEFDKRKVKIPGFVVPLEFDNDMVITEFFLVPFFGACIHLPPPPPNQIIHVEYDKGLQLDHLYDPFFIEGTIAIETVSAQEMGTSAYSIDVSKIYPYTE